jgi:hypothetical protein
MPADEPWGLHTAQMSEVAVITRRKPRIERTTARVDEVHERVRVKLLLTTVVDK